MNTTCCNAPMERFFQSNRAELYQCSSCKRIVTRYTCCNHVEKRLGSEKAKRSCPNCGAARFPRGDR